MLGAGTQATRSRVRWLYEAGGTDVAQSRKHAERVSCPAVGNEVFSAKSSTPEGFLVAGSDLVRGRGCSACKTSAICCSSVGGLAKADVESARVEMVSHSGSRLVMRVMLV